MTLRNTSTTYGSIAKGFHWAIAILLIGMLTYGYFLADIPGPYKGLAFTIHKLTGLLILLLAILRLLWAITNQKPSLPFDTLPWQRWIERIVHYSLYALLIAMPLAGWIGSVAGGRAPHLGQWVLTLPLSQNKEVVTVAFQIHDLLAIIFIVFISIHVLAALYHHFIKRDHVLRRILPSG